MDVEMLLGCETAVVSFEGLQNCFLNRRGGRSLPDIFQIVNMT